MLLAHRAIVSSAKAPIEPFTSPAHLEREVAREENLVDVVQEEELAKEVLKPQQNQQLNGKIEVSEVFSKSAVDLAICIVQARAESELGSHDIVGH